MARDGTDDKGRLGVPGVDAATPPAAVVICAGDEGSGSPTSRSATARPI
jgi:hypothetical protein